MNDRIARAALTRLFEPADSVGRALVAKHGAYPALRIAIGARPAYSFGNATADDLAESFLRIAVPACQAFAERRGTMSVFEGLHPG
jgi:DNA processing protein